MDIHKTFNGVLYRLHSNYCDKDMLFKTKRVAEECGISTIIDEGVYRDKDNYLVKNDNALALYFDVDQFNKKAKMFYNLLNNYKTTLVKVTFNEHTIFLNVGDDLNIKVEVIK